MMILDRMLFFAFLRAYAICLTSTLSLYIILDLFSNLDDFGGKTGAFSEVANNIFTYYSYRTIQYYDRLCEAIALLAAVFTIAWMQRNNELLPVLSAGVSTHRVIRPIILGAAVMLGVGVAIQELVIPRIAEKLVLDRDDLDREKEVMVQGAYDSSGIHIEGISAIRKEMLIKHFFATLPESPTSSMIHLSAVQGRYVPHQDGEPLSGGWLLLETQPAEIEPEFRPAMLTPLNPGSYFLRTNEVDFDLATKQPKWNAFASTHQLYDLLNKPDAPRQAGIAVLFHGRISRPAIGLLMVVLGLAIILRDQARHMFISAGLCLIMCASFFAVIMISHFLGENDYLSPALAAWFPALFFGPYAVVQYDAIHT
jgi:lipopolysaccharide export system permease protein